MNLSPNSDKKKCELTSTDKPEKIMKPVEFHPFLPDFHSNLYSIYQRLRSEDPVHKSFVGDTWVLTSYKDVKAIITDSRFGTFDIPKQIQDKHQYSQKKGKELNTLAYLSSKWLFYMNPPDHTRLRGLVNKALSSVKFDHVRSYIQVIVDELLDKVRHTGFIDIIADLAMPLPVMVIAKVLGIPPEDQELLHQWSNTLSRILDQPVSLEEYEKMNQAIMQFKAYLNELIIERIRKPQEDLITTLIGVGEQGKNLTEDEVLTTCILLFITGEETTVNSIGNGMLALLYHPEQMEKLKREPQIIPSAIEELLRYDSPVQITARQALETVEIGGQIIPSGEKILVCLGSANRDPEKFSAPDSLDLTRQDNHHLAFGDGIHHCLGARLARMQIQIAINTLVQQLPNLTLDTDKIEWRKNIALRGLTSLPVSFSL